MAEAGLPFPRWVKLLDQSRRIGCHACTTAYKSENEVPLGVTRTYVKSVDVGVFPLAGAGAAVVSELTVTDDITARRQARIPVADVDLHRALRAIWTGGRLPAPGGARELLAQVTACRGRAPPSAAGRVPGMPCPGLCYTQGGIV